MRVSDLERPDRTARLLDDVGASNETPGMLFVGLLSVNQLRYYPAYLKLEP